MWLNDPRGRWSGGVVLNRKSTPFSDIALPEWVVDPMYTSSQEGLNKLGTGLSTGEGIPDYYKPIGDFNSPQFQAMIKSVTGQIMQGSQEASAIGGTGRSGVALAASNDALKTVIPQLTYQDYTRALEGRGALLTTGANIQSGVRGSAQQQGLNESLFNQTLFQDKMALAGANDQWKKDASGAMGSMFGNILGMGASVGLAPFTGGASLMGLPGFASSAFGGSSGGSSNDDGGGLSGLFKSLGSLNLGGNRSGASFGISDPGLGSFSSLKGFQGIPGLPADMLS